MKIQLLYALIALLFTLTIQAQPTRGPGRPVPVLPVRPTGQPGKYVALLVGVAEYDDPVIPDLNYPLKDIEELTALLVKYNFKPSDIFTLPNPKEQKFFETLTRITQVLGPTDNLLIFFSGHGELVKDRNYYWLAADAQKASREGWISVPMVLEALGETDCKHTLLIIDSCHGGAVFKQIPASKNGAVADALRASSEVIRQYSELKSGEAITSGTPQEVVPDNSHFFAALKNCLTNNPYQYVLSSGLFNCIREQTISAQNKTTFKGLRITPQRSKINYLDDQGGEFIFFKPTGTPIIERPQTEPPTTAVQTVKVGKGTQELTMRGQPNQEIAIQATGSIVAGENVGTITPTGKTNYLFFSLSHYNLVPSFPHGALLYRLAPDAPWQYCGDLCTFQMPASGKATIQLTVNDNNQVDNSGAFVVKIQFR